MSFMVVCASVAPSGVCYVVETNNRLSSGVYEQYGIARTVLRNRRAAPTYCVEKGRGVLQAQP
jgi:hypothetical protein